MTVKWSRFGYHVEHETCQKWIFNLNFFLKEIQKKTQQQHPKKKNQTVSAMLIQVYRTFLPNHNICTKYPTDGDAFPEAYPKQYHARSRVIVV